MLDADAPSTATTSSETVFNTAASMQGSYSPSAPMQLGYEVQPLSSLSASANVDYAKLINSALAVDVLGGMLTGRNIA